MARPGLWRDAPGLLLHPKKPLGVVPSAHLAAMLPWALRFLRECHPQRVRHSALALGPLLRRAEESWERVFDFAGIDLDAPMGRTLCAAAPQQPFRTREGYLILQPTPAAMEASKGGAALRREGLGEALRMEALSMEATQVRIKSGRASDP